MQWVDVRDFGAVGDGARDNTATFKAADAAANGRGVRIPRGVFYLAGDVAFENRVQFEGTLVMPGDKCLGLRKGFDLDQYVAAFGDEVLAFRKAFQALLRLGIHDELDLCGRVICLSGPMEMAVEDRGQKTRPIIRNGGFKAAPSEEWADEQVKSCGTYGSDRPLLLTDVALAAEIVVGSRVSGAGVGREVYVSGVNAGALTVTLSQQLYGAEGTHEFTFTRHRYMMDFGDFAEPMQLKLSEIEFSANGMCSCLLMPPQGANWKFMDCDFDKPKDKGITSFGRACQGMSVDRCRFVSGERTLKARDRCSVGFNVNGDGAKIRSNRSVRMGHFAVLHGVGHMLLENHLFDGSNTAKCLPQAGLVLTHKAPKTVINSNYFDSNFIEWSDEHDAGQGRSGGESLEALAIVRNTFVTKKVAPGFGFVVLKRHGAEGEFGI